MSTATYEHRTGPQAPKYTHLAQYLRENPGQWVKVRTADNTNAASVAAHQIKNGRRAAFRPAGHYETYVQGNEIMARYNPQVGDQK